MKQHEYARLCLAIKHSHPDIYEETIGRMQATLSDTSVIPSLYDLYLESYPLSRDTKRDDVVTHELIFITSILYLYCPSALFLNLRVTDRICTILQRLMGYNNRQSISEKVSSARTYVKVKAFYEKVQIVSEQLNTHAQAVPSSLFVEQVSNQYEFVFK
ncbi:MAG TPA: hypothetical protein VGE26_02670 [Sphingobacteriaceae bacterium]